MSKTAQFGVYAAAFEKAYASDDWSVLEPFFTEAASYQINFDPPMGGCFEGRAAILAYFKQVVDQFDRKFESRELALIEGPREDGDSVWVRGRATYRAAGVPDLAFELEETAHFEGERICRLEDHYDDATKRQLDAYLGEHGAKLGISEDA
ncbi:MAG: nuclear transport factor 2 family protein [Deltaproteobacteria bacterium]|nr:nuclear transport factor 2 family protein [Deltaproteobacteria bacterium]MBW2540951.1 nuclear transport factor 2 family protein [Deltaproteobacteria bacterium]